jgi:hypothetical protein
MNTEIYNIWNEVRISDDTISISLIAEGDDGATVEDELFFTFEDLQSASGSIDRLTLRGETRETMTRTEQTMDGYAVPNPGQRVCNPLNGLEFTVGHVYESDTVDVPMVSLRLADTDPENELFETYALPVTSLQW